MPLLCVCLLLMALATGCAYDEAMDRGDAWARAGEWHKALDAYRVANRIEPGDPSAIEGIANARHMIAEAHVAAAKRSLAARDYEGAFELALEARAAKPELEAIELVLEAITSKVIGESTGLISQGHYPEGLQMLESIVRHRPEMAHALAENVQRAEVSWASTLRLKAADDEAAGHIGPALVRFAMAAGLSGEAQDAQARDRLRADLVRKHAFKIAFDVQGDPVRAADITSRVNGVLIKGTRALRITDKPTEPGVRLRAAVSAGVCQQSARVEVANHRYISGTRQVANPRWVRQREALVRAERDLLRLGGDADDRLDDLERAEEDLEKAERDKRTDLDRFRREVDSRRKKLRDARKGMRRAREEVLRCHDSLDRESPFLDEDVYSDFSYEVRHVSRTCRVPWEGQISDHRGDDPTPFRRVQRATTSDRTHAAHVRFGIAEDPLRFPSSDAALIASADRGAAVAIADIILERFSGHRATLIERAEALSASNPAESTRLYAIAYLLEPDDGLSGPGLHLKERYKMPDPYALVKRGL